MPWTKSWALLSPILAILRITALVPMSWKWLRSSFASWGWVLARRSPMTRSVDMASSTSWMACSPDTSMGNIMRG